jgi:16S rRNA (guanine966-N2)-methyltransferase
VADLFCGSGALGLEALSRGAESALFVDHDADALAAVRKNLDAVGLADRPATLVRATLPGWLASSAARAVDLALCDPPYGFDQWPALLEALEADRVVIESAAPVAPGERWVVTRERRYGGTLVTVAQRSKASAEDS